jgi:hypothetical protein
MTLVDVRKAVARAPRRKLDGANRQRRMGGNVATFVVQLLTWEDSGELEDYWIHKTRREWFESEAALTESMVKTARKTADEERLVKHEKIYRPGDRRPTTKYRVDMWELARVVNRSELENVARLLEHEGRKRERDRLNRKRRDLERASDDLNLLGERDFGNSEPVVEPGELSRQTRSSSPAYRSSLHSVVSDKSEPPSVVDEDQRVGSLMEKIKDRMLEAGYRLRKGELSFNRDAVRELLSEDAPTADELEDLPEGCVEYFDWRGNLDAGKALRRMRQQAVRSAMTANGSAAASPDHVIAAIEAHHESYTSKLAKYARQWDFRKQDEDPPWPVFGKLGGTDTERDKYLKRLRRLAREADAREDV